MEGRDYSWILRLNLLVSNKVRWEKIRIAEMWFPLPLLGGNRTLGLKLDGRGLCVEMVAQRLLGDFRTNRNYDDID